MSDAPVVVENRPDENRYVVVLDVTEAELVYERDGDRLVLIHTGVPDELSGHGIGGALVRAAVRDAEEQELTVVPRCPFARTWLEDHPAQALAVDIDWPS